MAEFCWDCYEDHGFGPGKENDFSYLSGLTSEWEEGGALRFPVLCEGCGFITVDRHGKCVSPRCREE